MNYSKKVCPYAPCPCNPETGRVCVPPFMRAKKTPIEEPTEIKNPNHPQCVPNPETGHCFDCNKKNTCLEGAEYKGTGEGEEWEKTFRNDFVKISGQAGFPKDWISLDHDGVQKLISSVRSLLAQKEATAREEERAKVAKIVKEILKETGFGEVNNDYVAAKTMYKGLQDLLLALGLETR